MIRSSSLRQANVVIKLKYRLPFGSFRSQRQLSTGHTPLRVLFCGADRFSIYSLDALATLKEQRPDIVASIDVVCRPDKLSGRGLKRVKAVPIKSVAQGLQLPLHQIDTFTGWSPPSPIDLIVAVSFGLLVPARLLQAAKYGGLNIHPSLLPEFRGPAPLHHTLLQRRSHTGITLQTMHPTRFDHGEILAQTPLPGIVVPENATTGSLVKQLGPIGATMLRNRIENSIFISPEPVDQEAEAREVTHAPKITPVDRRIDWASWSADEIILRDRVLGRLWDVETYHTCRTSRAILKRVIFEGPWRAVDEGELQNGRRLPSKDSNGPHLTLIGTPSEPLIAFDSGVGGAVIPTAVTIAGEKTGAALPGLAAAFKERFEIEDSNPE